MQRQPAWESNEVLQTVRKIAVSLFCLLTQGWPAELPYLDHQVKDRPPEVGNVDGWSGLLQNMGSLSPSRHSSR